MLDIGKQVKIVGTSRNNLNGQQGLAVNYNRDNGRYNVRLQNGTTMALKPGNLERLDDDDSGGSAGAGFGGFPGMGGMGGMPGMNSPQMAQAQQMAQQYLRQAQALLPPGVTPQQAGTGLLVLVVALIYFVGLFKGLILLGAIGYGALNFKNRNAIGAQVAAKLSSLSGKLISLSYSYILRVFSN